MDKNARNKIEKSDKIAIAVGVTGVVITTLLIKHKLSAMKSQAAAEAVQLWIEDNYKNGFMVFLLQKDLYKSVENLADTALPAVA